MRARDLMTLVALVAVVPDRPSSREVDPEEEFQQDCAAEGYFAPSITEDEIDSLLSGAD